MAKSILSLIVVMFSCKIVAAQTLVKGVVADMKTHQTLPFATVKYGKSDQGIITDIYGRFSINTNSSDITVSYLGYEPLVISVNNIDSIFLKPSANPIGEVVIRPPYEKIKRILNNAIRNKDAHNPDKYDWYNCHIYYKMTADLQPTAAYLKKDTTESLKGFTEKSHLFFSETYEKLYYKKPEKVQNIIIASRFSGLKKTYFTNLITGVIPFHVYDDWIQLIGNDYMHPVSNGWQRRYEYDLIDEFQDGTDTIFILKYRPKKNAGFQSLIGTVYINSNGYAISHFTGMAEDTVAGRQVTIEQIYKPVDGRWFPYELNYEFSFQKYPNPDMGALIVGHSVVDSVSFIEDKKFHFDKARAVILDDSVDLHTNEQWNQLRPEDLTLKEQNTYQIIDSISDKAGLSKKIDGFSSFHRGFIPLKFVDLDITKLLAYNNYEKTRLGLGLYTNDKISKYFSVGGWFGYGTKDKVWKYGTSLRAYPKGDKNRWVELSYQKNYRSTGVVNINPEVDNIYFRNWLLKQVDLTEDFKIALHDRFGYTEVDVYAQVQTLTPQYYINPAKWGQTFDIVEAGVNLRYAYGEKRTPLFGYYISVGTQYPIIYLSLSGGTVSSSLYTAQFIRPVAAINFSHHTNRWGKDNFFLAGGRITSIDNQPIPKPLLLAANGYRMEKNFQFYAQNGFITMLPYQYFNDSYISLFYKHDFDRRFYNLQNSAPFLSIANNTIYGSLSADNLQDNLGIQGSGLYNETGIILSWRRL